MTVTQADLQQSIDDLSAAIDRKNALMDELVNALSELLEDWEGWVTSVPDHPSHKIGNRALNALAKAKRGVSQP